MLIAHGLSNPEISDYLVVSEGTTKTHVSRIFAKLGFRDRAQAIATAYKSGLVQPEDQLPPRPGRSSGVIRQARAPTPVAAVSAGIGPENWASAIAPLTAIRKPAVATAAYPDRTWSPRNRMPIAAGSTVFGVGQSGGHCDTGERQPSDEGQQHGRPGARQPQPDGAETGQRHAHPQQQPLPADGQRAAVVRLRGDRQQHQPTQ